MKRIRSLAATAIAFAAFACGTPEPKPDAGTEPEDSGLADSGSPDAGRPDAGKPDAGPADAGFGPIDIENWCDMLALARCYRLSRCLSLDVEQNGECLAREKSGCDQNALTRGVKEGRIQYLPQQAAACINAYGSGSCTAEPAECESVFAGLVSPGGGCLSPADCEGGSYCLVYEQKCPFTCYRYRSIGESCDYWQAQCNPLDSSCQNVDGGMRCVPRAGLGEPCRYWSDCRSDLACIDQKCIQYTAKLGEACGEAGGFYYPTCEADAFCRQPHKEDGTPADAGVCMQRAALGGACSGYGTCKAGLRCSSNYATGTCIPLGKAGDTCSNYNDCQSELFCAPTTSRCTPLPADGGDCSNKGSSYRCATGYYCDFDSDTCLPLRALGEPCTYDGVCQSGSCEFGKLADGGSGYVCSPPCSVVADGGF